MSSDPKARERAAKFRFFDPDTQQNMPQEIVDLIEPHFPKDEYDSYSFETWPINEILQQAAWLGWLACEAKQAERVEKLERVARKARALSDGRHEAEHEIEELNIQLECALSALEASDD